MSEIKDAKTLMLEREISRLREDKRVMRVANNKLAARVDQLESMMKGFAPHVNIDKPIPEIRRTRVICDPPIRVVDRLMTKRGF